MAAQLFIFFGYSTKTNGGVTPNSLSLYYICIW